MNFNQVIAACSRGTLPETLTNDLEEVVAHCKATGRVGTLQLTLKVRPQGKDNDQVDIIPSIVAKAPREEEPSSVFYVAGDNSLMRDDPEQQSLSGIETQTHASIARAGGMA